MTWSYSGDPSASTSDAVRFLVGDTDTTDQLVTNEEIAYAITVHGNAQKAASYTCRAIAAKFARKADKQVGDLRINLSQQAKSYLDLAEKLEAQASATSVGMYMGARTITDKQAVEEDTDRVQPSFRKEQFENVAAYESGADRDAEWRIR